MNLLAPEEPHPVAVEREDGRSPFLLTCDHAGRAVPRSLGRLGVAEAEFERHVAWDIGIWEVSRRLGALLGATLIGQRYSRLVIDCNRPLGVAGSIPILSEATRIPGNIDLSVEDRAARVDGIFRPYHQRVAAILDARARDGRATVLVAMHSFTPVYLGIARPWHVGTLYGRDERLAAPLHEALAAEPGLVVGDNEPYAAGGDTDYMIPVQGEGRGLLHVGIEVRQDLIADEPGQAAWAERLARALPAALRRLAPALAEPCPRR